MMEWSKWKPIYQDIVKRLDLDTEMDIHSTRILSEMLTNIDPLPLLDRLDEKIRNKTVIVCGAGPSLEDHVRGLEERSDFRDFVFVVADGAVSLLLDLDYPCDIIVTDLDGEYTDLKQATDEGALTVVHGHGDNVPQIQSYVPTLGTVLGSTQVEPTNRAFLWGGFTDGDRACFLTATYAPREMILAGMDFGKVVGKWSKPSHKTHFFAPQRKQIKLKIAQELISFLFKEKAIPHTIL
jgi:uncharacterized Rossmann fold enzyme